MMMMRGRMMEKVRIEKSERAGRFVVGGGCWMCPLGKGGKINSE